MSEWKLAGWRLKVTENEDDSALVLIGPRGQGAALVCERGSVRAQVLQEFNIAMLAAVPEPAPYSPPFTADVPQCCGDPSSCDTPCAPEPAQEPVAWLYRSVSGDTRASHRQWRKFNDAWTEIPLYAAPPSDARDQLLRDVLDWFTKPAGMTPEIIEDRKKFTAFNDAIQAKQDALVERLRVAIAAEGKR